jgi:hypothetical protein
MAYEGANAMQRKNRGRLVIQRETLRSLTDRSLEQVGGGAYATTVDRCSTESMSKCESPQGPCRMRK